MKKLVPILIGLVFLFVSHSGFAQSKTIEGKTVEYSAQGVVMKGYLAYQEGVKEKRPGILVVHEWWGLNDYARKRAQMLAELG
jgi:hypothetical protein